jgi:hypothetical protein
MHDDGNDMSEGMGNHERGRDRAGHEQVSGDEMELDGPAAAMGQELASLPVPEAPPLGTIVARGRTLKHRRRAQLAGVGATAAIAAAVAVPVVAGLATSGGKGTTAAAGVHANLADFNVDSGNNGTVTVSWRKGVKVFDASGLREALAKAGVPAVVRVGTFCAPVAGPMSLTAEPATAAARAAVKTAEVSNSQSKQEGGSVIIRRTAIPARSQVSFDYVGDKMAVSVVPVAGALSCTANIPIRCTLTSRPGTPLPGPAGTSGTGGSGTTMPFSSVTGSTMPASTAPASTIPANELPPAAVPPSTPASTVPASTLPASTLPASTLPATTLGNGGSAPLPHPAFRFCVVAVSGPAVSGSGPGSATTTTGPSSTSTLPVSTSVTTTLPSAAG